VKTLIVVVGEYLLYVVCLIAALAALTSERERRNGMIKLAILSCAIALLVGWVTGLLYYHPRPFVVENIEPLIPHRPDNGFPSEHTLLAMVASAVVFAYNRKLGIILAVLAVLIGAARVAARLHYPVDVVGGISIALATTLVSWMTLRRVDRSYR
jgi:undecaprenyl-diphosphatase